MSMITIKNLHKKFGKKQVLSSLDLEVEEGQFLVMFGPDGAGKTSLFKILSTLLKPASGTVVINGHDINEEPIEVRGSIGFLSHDPLLYDDLTLKENLIFYSRMFRIEKDEEDFRTLADELGLIQGLNDKVGEFSRGMKQRAKLARAILHDPPVLLLDEPFTGLDLKGRDMLTNMLIKFHEAKKTLLLITHEFELGHNMGERLTILHNGEIAFDREKKEVDLPSFKEKYQSITGGQE